MATSISIQAQTTASISGTVYDSSGAPIPNAGITATNIETNVARKNTTAQDGSYSLTFMPLGTYKVEFDSDGFKKFEQKGIVLDVNRNASVDAKLQFGAVSETIEVTADAALVETSKPALGLTIENEDIENLPLVNRDVYSLLLLTSEWTLPGRRPTASARPCRLRCSTARPIPASVP